MCVTVCVTVCVTLCVTVCVTLCVTVCVLTSGVGGRQRGWLRHSMRPPFQADYPFSYKGNPYKMQHVQDQVGFYKEIPYKMQHVQDQPRGEFTGKSLYKIFLKKNPLKFFLKKQGKSFGKKFLKKNPCKFFSKKNHL